MIEECYSQMKLTESHVKNIMEAYVNIKLTLNKSKSFTFKWAEQFRNSNQPPYALVPYGSCLSGLATSTASDLDLTFLVHSPHPISHHTLLADTIKAVQAHGQKNRYQI